MEYPCLIRETLEGSLALSPCELVIIKKRQRAEESPRLTSPWEFQLTERLRYINACCLLATQSVGFVLTAEWSQRVSASDDLESLMIIRMPEAHVLCQNLMGAAAMNTCF